MKGRRRHRAVVGVLNERTLRAKLKVVEELSHNKAVLCALHIERGDQVPEAPEKPERKISNRHGNWFYWGHALGWSKNGEDASGLMHSINQRPWNRIEHPPGDADDIAAWWKQHTSEAKTLENRARESYEMGAEDRGTTTPRPTVLPKNKTATVRALLAPTRCARAATTTPVRR